MIRPATAADLDAVVALGASMASEAPRWRGMRYDGEKVRAFCGRVIEDETEGGLVLVHELLGEWGEPQEVTGVVVGVRGTHFFTDATYAAVMALYVAPHARAGGRQVRGLLRGFEVWAREHECAEVLLGDHTSEELGHKARLFRRLGYEGCGVDFRKAMR